MSEARLDKSKFKAQSFADADKGSVKYWRSRPWEERLQAGYHLSLRVYGYDPDNPPRLDKSVFKAGKRN